MFSRIIARKLSFKICIECKTVCPCIETKSCEYNDFKYSIKHYPKTEEYSEWYKKYVSPDKPKEEVVYY